MLLFLLTEYLFGSFDSMGLERPRNHADAKRTTTEHDQNEGGHGALRCLGDPCAGSEGSSFVVLGIVMGSIA